MAHGGARPGAGRKKSALTTKTREIAEIAIDEGITPLEILLKSMRTYWVAQNMPVAIDCAKIAAPYVHSKLASVECAGTDGGPLVPSKIEIVFVSSES